MPVVLPASFPFDEPRVDGADLRFVVDGAVVPHDVEVWNPSGAEGVFWVRVPVLPMHSGRAEVLLYFGNATAATTTASSAAWADEFELVLHMNDVVADATANAHAPWIDGSLDGPGAIGAGRSFTSSATRIDMGNILPIGGGDLTVTAWVRCDPSTPAYGKIASTNHSTGWALSRSGADGAALTFVGREANRESSIVDGEWHHVAGRREQGFLQVWVDGIEGLSRGEDAGTVASATQSLIVGDDPVDAPDYCIGDLDEVRVSAFVRTHAWIKAEAEGAALVTFGAVEPRP